MTTGSEIVKKLGQLGPSEMLRLKIDDLYALLVNTILSAPFLGQTKKEGQEKANLLPTVQATLRRFSAVATLSAPSLLPIPEVHVINEGENISNLQIEG